MKKYTKYSREDSFLTWGEKVEKWLVRFVVLGLVALVVTQALMTQDPFRFYLSFAERLDRNRLEESSGIQSTLAPGNSSIISEDTDPSAISNSTSIDQKSLADTGNITLELTNFSSLQKATILVNGQVVADFREKRVTIPVHSGDILEVDGSYYQHSLIILVQNVSNNVRYPKKHQTVKVEHSLVRMGRVTIFNK